MNGVGSLDGEGKVEMGIAMELLTGESMSALRDKYRAELSAARARHGTLVSAAETGRVGSESLLPSRRYMQSEEAQPGMHVSVAAYLGAEMLRCLRELHARGFVHRDVKPSNFVRRDRKSTTYCLVDFGLVKKVIGIVFAKVEKLKI
jgi:serine/threonine protein kinase